MNKGIPTIRRKTFLGWIRFGQAVSPHEIIKQSPEYTEESLLTRDDEAGLHRHDNGQEYWVDAPAAKAPCH